MKKDIENTQDIRQLVERFCEKIKKDRLLAPFFLRHVPVNWEKHVDVMTAFWENALFFTGSYTGNPIQSHRNLHQLHAMRPDHFDRWLTLFTQSVEELFEGEKAKQIAKKAQSLAAVMQIKVTGVSPFPADHP